MKNLSGNRCRRALAALVVVLGVGAAFGVRAQGHALGSELGPLLELAERNNPELQGMGWEAEAAKERIGPAGALPDPALAVELRDISTRDVNLSPSQVGNTRYQVRQTFPLWGKRELKAGVARADADAAGERVRAVRLDLRLRVTSAFSQYYAAEQAMRINGELRTVLDGLEEVARSRYATGLAPQQDAIRAQTERTLLASEIIALEAERHHGAARLNVALGRDAELHLAPPAALPPLPLAAADGARLRQTILAKNPQLAAAAAQIAAAQRNEELVVKNRYPDLTVGVAPIQTGSRFNTWELMFEVNIPLQQGARRAQEREAAAMRRAAEARRQSVANGLLGELGEATASFAAATRQLKVLRETLLPQAELTFQSALASYQNGKVDFTTLLEAQRQIRRTRLDIVRADVEAHVRLAEIERLIGEPL